MKKIFLLFSTLLAFGISLQNVKGQCAFPASLWSSANAPTIGGCFGVASSGVFASEYTVLNNLVAGQTYEIGTCASSGTTTTFDPNIVTLYGPAPGGSTVLLSATSTGAGGVCLTFTPTASGNYFANSNNTSCNGGTTAGNVGIRCLSCLPAAPPPPANNECATATALTLTPIPSAPPTAATGLAGSTNCATQSTTLPAPTCFATGINDDVWYTFTTAAAGSYIVQLNNIFQPGTTFSTTMGAQLYTGAGCVLVAAPTTCNATCQTSFPATVGTTNFSNFQYDGLLAGTTYTLRIATTATTAIFANYSIMVGQFAAAPANDNCSGAVNVPLSNAGTCLGGGIAGTTIAATGSCVAESICAVTVADNDDVWYTFTTTNAGNYVIELNNIFIAGSTVTTTTMGIQVYTGLCGALVGPPTVNGKCATFFPSTLGVPTGVTNFANFSLTGLAAATTYTVKLYTTAGPGTNASFNIKIYGGYGTPANDNCPGAITIPTGAEGLCSALIVPCAANINATQGFTPCSGNALDDVWYSVTPPAGVTCGKLTIASNNTFRPVFELNTTGCAGPPAVAPTIILNSASSATTTTSAGTCYSNNTPNGNLVLDFSNLTPGQPYYFKIHDFLGAVPTITTGNALLPLGGYSLCFEYPAPDYGIALAPSPNAGCGLIQSNVAINVTWKGCSGSTLSAGTSIPYQLQIDGGAIQSGTLTLPAITIPAGATSAVGQPTSATGILSTIAAGSYPWNFSVGVNHTLTILLLPTSGSDAIAFNNFTSTTVSSSANFSPVSCPSSNVTICTGGTVPPLNGTCVGSALGTFTASAFVATAPVDFSATGTTGTGELMTFTGATPFLTIPVTGIPLGATVTSVVIKNTFWVNSFAGEAHLGLQGVVSSSSATGLTASTGTGFFNGMVLPASVGADGLATTIMNFGAPCVVGGPVISTVPFTNGNLQLYYDESFDDFPGATDLTGFPATGATFNITVTYVINGSLTWWNAPTGGTQIGTGNGFVPTAPAVNTAVPGVYTVYAQCSDPLTPTCGLSTRTPITITVNAPISPTTPTNLTLCAGSSPSGLQGLNSVCIGTPLTTTFVNTTGVPFSSPTVSTSMSVPVSSIPTGSVITNVSMNINMATTWVGDQTIAIQAPGGTLGTIMTGFGGSSNMGVLAGNGAAANCAPYTYATGAATMPSSGLIPSGTYAPPSSATVLSALNGIIQDGTGTEINGNWLINFGDNGFDTYAVCGSSITITYIPPSPTGWFNQLAGGTAIASTTNTLLDPTGLVLNNSAAGATAGTSTLNATTPPGQYYLWSQCQQPSPCVAPARTQHIVTVLPNIIITNISEVACAAAPAAPINSNIDISVTGFGSITTAAQLQTALTAPTPGGFGLPVGSTLEYSIDGGAWTNAPTGGTTPGCHNIRIRVSIASPSVAAAYKGCQSKEFNYVRFPQVPVVTAHTLSNPCGSPTITSLTVTPSTPAGMKLQYSKDNIVFTDALPALTPGCTSLYVRFATASTCGTGVDGDDFNTVAASTIPTNACTSAAYNIAVFPNVPAFTNVILSTTCGTADVTATDVPSETSAGFTIEYSFDGGAFAATLPAAVGPGCHNLKARYVTAAVCGATAAASPSPVACQSKTVNFVVYPAIPTLTFVSNVVCGAALVVNPITDEANFIEQYSFDNGTTWGTTTTSPTTSGCYNVLARYALTTVCGTGPSATAHNSLLANSTLAACNSLPVVGTIFPTLATYQPIVSITANCADVTGNGAASIATPAPVAGFTAQYALVLSTATITTADFAAANNINTNLIAGCYQAQIRWVANAACGTGAIGDASAISCYSLISTFVIYPDLSAQSVSNVVTAAACTSTSTSIAAATNLTLSSAIPAGFTAQYSVDGAPFVSTFPIAGIAPGCHTIRYRVVNTCGVAGAALMPTLPNTCISAISNFIVYPSLTTNAITSVSLSATCGDADITSVQLTNPINSAFSLQYSLNDINDVNGFGAGFKPYASSLPTILAPGCYQIKVIAANAAACGTVVAGTTSAASCESVAYDFVIYPDLTLQNVIGVTLSAQCTSSSVALTAITLPPSGVPAGFVAEFSIDGATFAALPAGGVTGITPGCHYVVYRVGNTCGAAAAAIAPLQSAACISKRFNFVVYPDLIGQTPVAITSINCGDIVDINTVSGVTIPAGFIPQYSIDGTTWGDLATVGTGLNIGCIALQARAALASNCGNAASDANVVALNAVATTTGCPSDITNTVLWPSVSFDAVVADCATGNLTITTTTNPVVLPADFAVSISIDGGTTYSTTATTTGLACGVYNIISTTELTSACGTTTAGTLAPCASNSIAVAIHPDLTAAAITSVASCTGVISITTPAVCAAALEYQYSFDGGASYQTSNVSPTLSPGTYSIKVRTHVIANNASNNTALASCEFTTTTTIGGTPYFTNSSIIQPPCGSINGQLLFTPINANFYGISTAGAATYDGPAYASMIPATGATTSPNLPVVGATNTNYIIRLENGAGCFTDITVTIVPPTACGCPVPPTLTTPLVTSTQCAAATNVFSYNYTIPSPSATVVSAVRIVGISQVFSSNGTSPFTFDIDGTTVFPYTLLTTGGSINANSTAATAGTYTFNVIVDDPSIPCNNSFTLTATVLTAPILTSQSVPVQVCEGTIVNLVSYVNGTTLSGASGSLNFYLGTNNTGTSLGTNTVATGAIAGAQPYTFSLAAGPSTAIFVEFISNATPACNSSFAISIPVTPLPIPLFSHVDVCANAPTVSFVDATTVVSVGATYAWNFGDGSAIDATVGNVTHTYGSVGNYTATLTVTNNPSACAVVYSAIVKIYPLPDITIISNNASFCKDAPAIALTNGATPTGGLWTIDGTVATTLAPALLTAGVHTLTYTAAAAANSCAITYNFNINNDVVINSMVDGAAYCSGANSIPLAGTPTAGTFYLDNVIATNFNPATVGVGSHAIRYDVTSNGITCSEEITIIVNALPMAAAGADAAICLGSGPIVIGSATNTAYTYAWDNGAGSTSNPLVNPVITTTYNVVVTETATGCTATDAVIVTVNTLPTSTVVATQIPCFAGTGSIALTPSGTAPFTYLWSNGDFNKDINGVTAGTYTVTVTDANGCSVTATTTINAAPTAITLAAVTTNETCSYSNNGSINLTTTGGIGAITYIWSNAATSEDITTLASGAYSVTASDANGCSASATFNVTEPAVLVANAGLNTSLCLGGSVTLAASATGGTGAYTYNWDNGAGAASTATVAPTSTTTYNVTVTDANTCTASAAVTVIVNPLPTATIVNTPIACAGGKGDLNLTPAAGTAPYTFAWNDASGSTIEDLSGLSAGTYSVTVTDLNGCTATASSTIVAAPTPITLAAAVTNETCNYLDNGAIDLTATGGSGTLIYTWSNTTATQDVTSLSAGTYSVTVSDANACSATASYLVTQPSVLTAVANGATSLCAGATANITAIGTGGTGAYTYMWDDLAMSATASISVTPAITTTYNVIITDASTCTATAAVTVTVNELPTATPSAVQILCNGGTGSVSVVAAGGLAPYTYIWNDPNGSTNTSVPGLAAGTYNVTVTDANGCTSTAATIINAAPANLTTTGTSTDVICNGGNDGTIDIAVSGGTGIYTYTWSNGASTEDVISLIADVYRVTVTDGNGCTSTASYTIAEPTLLSVTTIGTNPLCSTGTGTIDVTTLGGTLPYTYLWNDGSTTEDISGLSAGVYTVTITDGNLCTANSTFTIIIPTAITATVASTNESCPTSTDGTISITATGGTGALQYSIDGGLSWTTASTFTTLSGTVGGTLYDVQVRDANLCLIDATDATITAPTGLIGFTLLTTPTGCAVSDGSINITAGTGGVAPYTYSIDGGVSTQASTTFAGLPASTGIVTVTDANGCTRALAYNVGSTSGITAGVSAQTNIACNGAATGSFTVSVFSGTASSYSYNAGATYTSVGAIADADGLVVGLTAGTYSMQVTDGAGCTFAVNNIIITSPSAQNAGAATTTGAKCNGSADGSITVSTLPTGGVAPYSYSIDGGLNWQSSVTFVGLVSGAYVIAVEDANGCAGISMNATVTAPALISGFTATTTASQCTGATGTVAITAGSGGTSPYSYSLNGGAAQVSTTFASVGAGSGFVTITDAAGCSRVITYNVASVSGLTGSTGATNITCNGANDGTVTATAASGTAPYTYLYSAGGAFVSPGTADIDGVVTGLGAGLHTVRITDANGCVYDVASSITQPATLTATATATAITCAGGNNGTSTATATGGTSPYTYIWNDAAAQITPTAVGLVSGTYACMIMDANGCMITSNTVVIANPAALVATNPSFVACSDAATSYNLSQHNATIGTGTVTWYIGNPSTVGTAVAPTQNLSTNPDIWAVLSSGGCTATVDVTYTINTTPALITAGATACSGATTVGLNYTSIGTPTGYSIDFDATSNAAGLVDVPTTALPATSPINITLSGGESVGVYNATVTVIDAATGCTSSTGITISINASTTSGVATAAMNVCASTVASIIDLNTMLVGATSGGTWTETTTPATGVAFDATAGTFDPSGQGAGVYTFAYTIIGCGGVLQSSTVTLNINAVPTASIVATQIVCNGGTGSLNLSVAGGTSPYSYAWNDASGATIEDLSGQLAGTYNVTVTDANGCTVTTSATINAAPTAIAIALTSQTNNTCNGDNTGAIDISVSGGTGSYTYVWSNGSNTQDLSGLTAGAYTGVVTDANGCTASATVSITQPAAEVAMFTLSTSSACVTSTTAISAIGSVGQAAGVYSISPTVGGFNPITGGFNASAGTAGTTYTISYTTTGCGIVASATVSITTCTTPPPPTGTIGGSSSFVWNDLDNDGVYDGPEPYTDGNGDGVYNAGELYTDLDGDGVYDSAAGEFYTDTNANGTYDIGEPYIDSNLDGIYNGGAGDTYTDVNGDGMYGYGDSFVDTNGDGNWNLGEPFTDGDFNGVYTSPEPYMDNTGNGYYTPMEYPLSGATVQLFSNLGPDGIAGNADDNTAIGAVVTGADGSFAFGATPANSTGETYTDSNGDGVWNVGEAFIDSNGNGVYNGPSPIDYTVVFPTSVSGIGTLTLSNSTGGGAATVDDGNDSDANASTGATGSINVPIGGTFPNINAGYWSATAPTAGTVDPCTCMNNADATGAVTSGQFSSLITITGGVGPYSIMFSTPNIYVLNASNEINTIANITNLPAEADGTTNVNVKYTDGVGIYSFTVTDATGNTFTAGPFSTCTYPTLNPIGDVTVCGGATVSLQASGTGTGVSYAWSNGANTSLTSVVAGSNPSTMPYTVTISDANGCVVSEGVNVIASCTFATVGDPSSLIVLENMVYVDLDSSGTYEPGGDPFNDINGNGVYDAGTEIYSDANGDGLYTEGDFPVGGAIIQLYNNGADGIEGTADDIALFTTSDATGHYEFSGLTPGTYEIEVNASNAYAFTVNGAPNSTGSTTIVLGSGANTNPIFGLVIGGTTVVSVDLFSFEAKDNCNSIEVTWTVGVEDNVSRYFVQRSYDGVSYSTIGEVEAVGNATYSFTDATPRQGDNYYRLAMLNTDNSIKNSSIVVAESKCQPTIQVINVYPNPVDHTLYFNIASASKMEIQLVIIDEIGRIVISTPKQVEAGVNTLDINVAVLAKAVYYAGIVGEDGTFIGLSKIVVTH